MMKRTEHILFLVAFATCAHAAYDNTTLNISAAGSTSSSVRYSNVGAIVPLGGQTSYKGTLHHQSGFAAGFILQPQTAFGALPDELNPDNDSDGMNDDSELIAGTSPVNRNSFLEVSCEVLAGGGRKLSCFGVTGRSYTFQYRDELTAGDWQSYPPELTGSGATLSMVDSSPGANRFYRVKVRMSG